MTLILGFAPFILFALLSRLSADLALWVAFAAAFVVTIRDFVESPSLRLLDGASLILFGLLALGRGFLAPELSLAAVRTIVDAGPVPGDRLFRLLRRQPFSLQYASRETQGRHWPLPAFLRVNYVISLVWLVAFAAMTLADAAVAFLPAAALCRHRRQRRRAWPSPSPSPCAIPRWRRQRLRALTSAARWQGLGSPLPLKEHRHETGRHRLHRAHRPGQIGARRLQPDPWRGDGRPCRQARHRHAPGSIPAKWKMSIMGCGMPEGATGNNIARESAIWAGCPVTTAGVTINRYCSSGLNAIAMAAQQIMTDGTDIAVGAGVESISLVQMGGINLNHFTEEHLLAGQAGAVDDA